MFLLFLCSCSKEPVNDNNKSNENTLSFEEAKMLCGVMNGHKVSLEEAIMQLQAMFKSGSGNKKSALMPSILDVRAVRAKYTRTKSDNSTDTLYYVVNFVNDQGFAVLSADDRVDPILCVTESGYLGDTVDNPGMVIFLTNSEDYIKSKIDEYDAVKDSLIRSAMRKLQNGKDVDSMARKFWGGDEMDPGIPVGPDNYITLSSKSYGPWVLVKKKDSLLLVKWNQRFPFNSQTPRHDCSGCSGGAPAGCVPTAIAMIMSYYKCPTLHNGVSYNWNTIINNTYNSNIGMLVGQISDKLTMMYLSCNGSFPLRWPWPAGSRTIDNCFMSMGYSDPNGFWEYAFNHIESSLDLNRPVYVEGYEDFTSVFKGHAWVVDGYKREKSLVTYVIQYYKPNDFTFSGLVKTEVYTNTEYREVVHCNWGWGGDSNGDFLSGVFKPENPKSNFQYSQKLIKDIYPR